MRHNLDIRALYSDYDELKRVRSAYLVHLLDLMLRERETVHRNSLAIAAEEAGEELVTVENVFELAKKMDGESDSDSES